MSALCSIWPLCRSRPYGCVSTRHRARECSRCKRRWSLRDPGASAGPAGRGPSARRRAHRPHADAGPTTVARVNTPQGTLVTETQQKLSACQPGEVLPRGTSAIRLRTYAFLGPRVTVSVLAHGHVIAHGERGSRWTGGVVTVPVNRLSTARSGWSASRCSATGTNRSSWWANPDRLARSPPAGRAGTLPGRVRVEYLRSSGASWWSLCTRSGTSHGTRPMQRPAPASVRLPCWSSWAGHWSRFCSRLILRKLL